MSSANFRFQIGLSPITIHGVRLYCTSYMISSTNILKNTSDRKHPLSTPTVMWLIIRTAMVMLLYKALIIVINS